jgi:predicted dienelactone hydrolase
MRSLRAVLVPVPLALLLSAAASGLPAATSPAAPATGPGPFPVIVFSHGLGGSREGYKYLGRHWASYGYVAVHVEHLGSDTAAFTKRPRGRLLANMGLMRANR